MIVNESDWDFEIKVAGSEEDVRDHKGVHAVDFVFESGSVSYLGALDGLSQRREVEEGVEQEPHQEEGVGVGVPEVSEGREGGVETKGTVRGAAEHKQPKDHGRETEGHQERANGAKELVLLGLRGPLKLSLLG